MTTTERTDHVGELGPLLGRFCYFDTHNDHSCPLLGPWSWGVRSGWGCRHGPKVSMFSTFRCGSKQGTKHKAQSTTHCLWIVPALLPAKLSSDIHQRCGEGGPSGSLGRVQAPTGMEIFASPVPKMAIFGLGLGGTCNKDRFWTEREIPEQRPSSAYFNFCDAVRGGGRAWGSPACGSQGPVSP